MQLTNQELLILEGIVCPYCLKRTELVHSDKTFNKNTAGYKRVCHPCDAWVYCFSNSKTPMGSVAKKELRNKRSEVRYYIDMLNRSGLVTSKNEVFVWIARILHKPYQYSHVDMMDVFNCNEVIYEIKSRLLDADIPYRQFSQPPSQG